MSVSEVTSARPVARFTATDSTPDTPPSARSTRRTHEAQVIPAISSSSRRVRSAVAVNELRSRLVNDLPCDEKQPLRP